MEVTIKAKGLLHGGDYNPDQWLKHPEILKEDIRLMKLAHCNTVTINIFGWSAIEPEEGKYNFKWLDDIISSMEKNDINVILATPSGARPAWMSKKYPEVLRVNSDRSKNLHGLRHNHCFTSPVYRKKTYEINKILAERYKNSKALILWHVSNEYGGECHCPLCQEAFREFLKKKYDNDIEKLNDAWWTSFWSHRFNDFSQIESPSEIGESAVHGLNLDWKRFVTHQTIEFYKNEIKPLREITPYIPVTTNFMGDAPVMGLFKGLDYSKFAKEVDIVSWDSYPAWHNDFEKTYETASNTAFVNDIFRSMKGNKPFLIMENTPSLVNWHEVNKLKRPGMHLLASMQSIAHGADSVLYFQWRKGRGASEKFHGAVVDHEGSENTRVFREVTEVGKYLEKIQEVKGLTKKSEVAVIYDMENDWAIEDLQGLKMSKKNYETLCQQNYRSFWEMGVTTDVISMDYDFSKYKLIVAPMLYMVKPGCAERLESFVSNGGTLVLTYFSGVVDENDLCFLGGFPGPLRKLAGIWAEEIDSLYDNERNYMISAMSDMKSEYEIKDYCEIIHTETAKVLGKYKEDFYEGMPVVTVNNFGKGKCYYLAANLEQKFLDNFYKKLVKENYINTVLDVEIPLGVSVQTREDENNKYIFIMNFNEEEKIINLGENKYIDIITGDVVTGEITLKKYGVRILKSKKERF